MPHSLTKKIQPPTPPLEEYKLMQFPLLKRSLEFSFASSILSSIKIASATIRPTLSAPGDELLGHPLYLRPLSMMVPVDHFYCSSQDGCNFRRRGMEQRRNGRAGETRDPRENPPTSGIIRHDSHLQKSRVTWPGIDPVRLVARRPPWLCTSKPDDGSYISALRASYPRVKPRCPQYTPNRTLPPKLKTHEYINHHRYAFHGKQTLQQIQNFTFAQTAIWKSQKQIARPTQRCGLLAFTDSTNYMGLTTTMGNFAVADRISNAATTPGACITRSMSGVISSTNPVAHDLSPTQHLHYHLYFRPPQQPVKQAIVQKWAIVSETLGRASKRVGKYRWKLKTTGEGSVPVLEGGVIGEVKDTGSWETLVDPALFRLLDSFPTNTILSFLLAVLAANGLVAEVPVVTLIRLDVVLGIRILIPAAHTLRSSCGKLGCHHTHSYHLQQMERIHTSVVLVKHIPDSLHRYMRSNCSTKISPQINCYGKWLSPGADHYKSALYPRSGTRAITMRPHCLASTVRHGSKLPQQNCCHDLNYTITTGHYTGVHVWDGLRDIISLVYILHRVISFLETDLRLFLQYMQLAKQREMWLQPGVPPHFNSAVNQFLNAEYSRSYIERGDPVLWPSRSPNFSHWNIRACSGRKPDTGDQLIWVVIDANTQIRNELANMQWQIAMVNLSQLVYRQVGHVFSTLASPLKETPWDMCRCHPAACPCPWISQLLKLSAHLPQGLPFPCWGRGTVVVRLLTTHQGEPGLIPGGVTPAFSHVRIVPDNVAGRRVFRGISRFPYLCSPALPHTRLASPSLAVKISIACENHGYVKGFHQSPFSLLSMVSTRPYPYWSTGEPTWQLSETDTSSLMKDKRKQDGGRWWHTLAAINNITCINVALYRTMRELHQTISKMVGVERR
ncbi:hypothetical protein PR048_013264 [Dryococelus australis]|uniref:Uncharacterized protein n=1 Tax=Dryococelus australis TaxID=614101 RepID=A0ABQ9HSH6_9NEOP|nr:hypothetical protein PR048_013264 [Dryococelus australis]